MNNIIPFSALLLTIVMSTGLVGCGSLPKYANTRPTVQPTLYFANAPEGATIEIDGLPVHTISKKARTVDVAAGTHQVVVRKGETMIHQEQVFIQGDTKKIVKITQP